MTKNENQYLINYIIDVYTHNPQVGQELMNLNQDLVKDKKEKRNEKISDKR